MRHRFHALCPYFAMFPESFAEGWINKLSGKGDVVLDPFSGRGTTAFSAILLGRTAVACDVNDVAYCLTRAKTHAPSLRTVLGRIASLEGEYRNRSWRKDAAECPEFFHYAYHGDTLRQLLYLRKQLAWKRVRSDTMIASLVLGALHGETNKSPSYLSNQMPRTISTKPAYSIRFWQKHGFHAPERDVFALLKSRAAFRYETPPPDGRAIVLQRDMRELPRVAESFPGPIRCVITSPPYLDVTNFEEDQWLRLWFLGGPPYPQTFRLSRDDRYRLADDYWRFIADMWRVLGTILQRGADIVIRLGSSRVGALELQRQLTATSQFSGRRVHLVKAETSDIIRRQTRSFRPGSTGCSVEIDCHFAMRN